MGGLQGSAPAGTGPPEIYYRPLLAFAAALSADEMALSPQAARERLAAVGYADPDGPCAIQALTEGVSRRAAIQRRPAAGHHRLDRWEPPSSARRETVRVIGGSHWYLAMLRTRRWQRAGLPGLSGAHWATERLRGVPESIAWLDDDDDRPRRSGALAEEVAAVLRRRSLSGPDDAAPPSRRSRRFRRS